MENILKRVTNNLEFLCKGDKPSIEYLTTQLTKENMLPPNGSETNQFTEFDAHWLGPQIVNADKESRAKILEQVRGFLQSRLECLQSRDFEGYLSKFHKPSLYLAFRHICLELSSEQYWRLLKLTQTSTETIFDNRHTWLRYWRSAIPNRRVKTRDRLDLMNIDERTVYDNLPEIFTAYRGVANDCEAISLNWTLDRKIAESFSNKYANKASNLFSACIATLQIDKEHVFAFIDDRSERELIVDFERLNENAIQWEFCDEILLNEFSDANSKAYSDAA